MIWLAGTIILAILLVAGLWYLKSPTLGLLLVLLSLIPGQVIRLSLGTDVRGGSAIIMSDIAILVVVIVWLIRKLTKETTVEPNRLTGPLLTFIGIALASVFQGYVIIWQTGTLELKEMLVAFMYWVRFVEYALVFFIAWDVIKTGKEIRTFLKWIFITGVLIAIGGFIQLVIMPDFTEYAIKYGWDPHYYRLLSSFFDPNFVGGYFGMVMSVAIAMLFYEENRTWKRWLAFSIMIMGVALMLTISRSGLLALVGGLFVIGVVRSRLFLLLGFIGIVLSLLLYPRLFDRITEGFSLDETGVKRIESWSKGLTIMKAYPILGVGYNNLASVQDDLGMVDEFDVNNRGGFENSLLTIFVTTGIVGFTAYLYMLFILLYTAYRNYLQANAPPWSRGVSLGIFAGIIGIIANSMFINSLLYPFILINLWIMAAIVMRINADIQRIQIK
jgi:hypothetical protein